MRTQSSIEPKRIRITKSTEKTHKDHVADRGHACMSHYNAKAAFDKEWEHLGRVKSEKKSRVVRRAKVEGKESPPCHIHGLVSSQEHRIGDNVPKVQRKSGIER